ncbi:MAG: hypothetical protein SFY69_07990 [Planctomycetota bacterium]|nr:hypothetical protein [Planctomycetota bacterium]
MAAGRGVSGSVYDGLTPRHAVCEACGQHLGGTEVKGGALVCPECGHANVMGLPPPGTHAARLRRVRARRTVVRVLMIGVLAAGLVAVALLM